MRTHRVALLLVPLFVVAGNADVRETGLLLHVSSRWHSKVQGHKVLLPSCRERTSSIQLSLPHPGSELQGTKEKRPLGVSGSAPAVPLSGAVVVVRTETLASPKKTLVFKTLSLFSEESPRFCAL